MSNALFVAMPKSGQGVRVYESAVAHYLPSIVPGTFSGIVRGIVQSSLLTHGFNRLWCEAMTRREALGIKYFGMIHDDIACGPGWADTLKTILDEQNWDLVSVVVPIKDERGVTSTGRCSGDQFSPHRYTMKEIHEKPETWTEPKLLVNTGLWLCRLDRPWCEKVMFRQQDQVLRADDGKRFIARTNPEDWDFSRQLQYLNVPFGVTRKVPLYHEQPKYANNKVWGTWETDKGDKVELPTEDAGAGG